MIGLERSQNNAIIRLFMNGVSASAFGIKKGASALTSIFRILSVPTRTKMISEIVTTTEKSYGLRSLNNLIESKLMKLCKTKEELLLIQMQHYIANYLWLDLVLKI